MQKDLILPISIILTILVGLPIVAAQESHDVSVDANKAWNKWVEYSEKNCKIEKLENVITPNYHEDLSGKADKYSCNNGKIYILYEKKFVHKNMFLIPQPEYDR